MEKLSIDFTTNSVFAIFDNYIKEDSFKEFALSILDKVKSSGKRKMLCDTSGLKVMPQSIQEWINGVWFSEANKLGVSHLAFIVPENLFGKLSMEQTNSKKENIGSIDIKYFNGMNTAKDWLNSN